MTLRVCEMRSIDTPRWIVASNKQDETGAREVIGLFHDEAAARWFADGWKGTTEMMRVDMREHAAIREQVHAGLSALRVQGRQIWGDDRLSIEEIVIRLMVGVGDLARLARSEFDPKSSQEAFDRDREELKKELGNIIFSIIRWVDDLGLDVLECLDLAIEAQERFANSGRAR